MGLREVLPVEPGENLSENAHCPYLPMQNEPHSRLA